MSTLSVKFGVLALFLLQSHNVAAQMQSISKNSTEKLPGPTGFPPCDALISAGLGDRVLLATSSGYESRVESFWNDNSRLRPWCFVQPYNTSEVSTVVSTLAGAGSGAGDWHIAVRSGGHHLPGTNNIAAGVTIDLGMMNSSSYDPDRGLASVEPGARWKDVNFNLLQNGNVTVVGGRDGGVGVGGFLTGGGMSYYTGRRGFGCDTIASFEVVLANGSIVEANADLNADLYKALKGGSLNFGIVTRFDLEAIPAVDIALGQSIIASEYSDDVVEAVVEFTDNQENLRDDALITVYNFDTTVNENISITATRINTRGNINTTSFDRVKEIPSSADTWVVASLADATNTSLPAGTKHEWTTLTFHNSPVVLRGAASLYAGSISCLSNAIGAENYNAKMVFQAFPSYLSTLGQRNGGNMMNLEHMSSNSILWTVSISVTSGDDAHSAVAQAELRALASRVKELAAINGAAERLVYLNYAHPSQDPLTSYGASNVAFMEEVAKQYDPQGWWQKMVPGGFKLSRVVL